MTIPQLIPSCDIRQFLRQKLVRLIYPHNHQESSSYVLGAIYFRIGTRTLCRDRRKSWHGSFCHLSKNSWNFSRHISSRQTIRVYSCSKEFVHRYVAPSSSLNALTGLDTQNLSRAASTTSAARFAQFNTELSITPMTIALLSSITGTSYT